MLSEAQFDRMTAREYLHLERQSSVRHEYIAGQIYAMTGGSEQHNTIAVNLIALIRPRLRGSDCRIFSSDMKIRIESLDIFYYPDLSVTCNPNDRHKYFKKYPCLIIETLSPSTERVDRNEKLLNYRQLESLQEYILISQNKPQVEIYRKDSQGKWNLEILEYNDILRLESLGFEIKVTDIYEDVDLDSVANE